MPFLTTRNSIEYELLPQYRETYTSDGQQEIVQFAQVSWEKGRNFCTAIMPDVAVGAVIGVDAITISEFVGDPARDTNLPRKELVRLLPQAHPTRANYYVTNVALVEGQGYPVRSIDNDIAFISYPGPVGGDAPPRDGLAMFQVTYRTLPYVANVPDADTNLIGQSELRRYVSRKSSVSGKNLPLPGQRIRLFDENNVEFDAKFLESVTKSFSWQHLTYTWHMVPVVPRAAKYMAGKVNLVEFDVTDTVFLRGSGHIGTVLYIGESTSDSYSTISGNQVRDITYNLLHLTDISSFPIGSGGTAVNPDRVIGHNHVFSPQQNRWGRALVPQSVEVANVPAGWAFFPDALCQLLAVVRPPTFSAPMPAGQNIYNYANLNNLFKIDG